MTNDTQARAGPDPCSQITDDSKELIHHLRGLDRDCLLERNLHHERSCRFGVVGTASLRSWYRCSAYPVLQGVFFHS